MRPKELKDYCELAETRNFKYLLNHIPQRVGWRFNESMWECGKCKYQWAATYNKIQQGKGCPKCAGNIPKTLEDYKNMAEQKGFKYVQNHIPTGVHRKIKKPMWECDKKHQWSAQYSSIQQGYGCPKCYGNFPKVYQDYIDLAKRREIFYILSSIPKNAATKPLNDCWMCIKEHKWSACYTDINDGNGCPICKLSKREIRIKNILEENKINYQREFKIKNCNKRYDFYLPDFKVFIEIDGEQHFISTNYNKKYGIEYSRKVDVEKTINAFNNGFRIIRLDYKFIDKHCNKKLTKFILRYVQHYCLFFKFSNDCMYEWIINELQNQGYLLTIILVNDNPPKYH